MKRYALLLVMLLLAPALAVASEPSAVRGGGDLVRVLVGPASPGLAWAGEQADPDSAAALIRRAFERAAEGRAPAALAVLDSAASVAPWFGDWIDLFAAEIAAEAGDTATVRARLAGLDADLLEGRGWRFRVEAAREAGDERGAMEAALKAARGTGSAGDRGAAWALLGELRLSAGDRSGAREAYGRAMDIAPGGMAGVDAARAMSGLDPDPAEWRAIASIYQRHGNQARAIDGFRRYLESGAGDAEDRLDVRLRLGQAYFNAGRYGDAERHLGELVADGPPADVGAEALYLVGRSQYRQGQTSRGQNTLAELADRFPGQEATTRGLYLLADLKHDDLELEEARAFYREAAAASPDLNEAGLALMRLGGMRYLEGDYQAAADIYEEYRASHPNGRRISQATYWAARSYGELGREEEARQLLRSVRRDDPISYYGMRAAELLGEDMLDLPMESAPATDPATDSLIRADLRRVDLLNALDRRGDLVLEVERLRRGFDDTADGAYALAEALNERGHTLTGINMGWSIRRDGAGWNPRLLRIIYPFPFRDMILPAARARGVDPYLVAGLIRRESAFNPTVVSPAGAIGLMQIMPETGRGLARGAGIGGYSPELLKDPATNVQLGMRFLDELLGRFGDEGLPLTLSAYNAGPTRAVRWRDLPEHGDPELFTERIPYRETRDYVRHVLLHRALYQALYPELGTAPDDG